MAQQTPDPKLIDSMAMRYRHDFGLLEEPHKEAIRTTMKQLWEEVVGLGFYKDEKFGNSEQLAQQTAVEWLVDQVEDFIGLIPIDIIQQAKEKEFRQHGLFLHWVIKHYSTETIDGMFAWVDSMGKEVTVREIVEHYYKDEKFGNSEQLAQQTAVEWLYNDLFPKKLDGFSDEEWSKIIEAFEQAKEMDKRQKKRAWDRGKYIGQSFPKGQIEPEYEQDAEEYYTQTYGK